MTCSYHWYLYNWVQFVLIISIPSKWLPPSGHFPLGTNQSILIFIDCHDNHTKKSSHARKKDANCSFVKFKWRLEVPWWEQLVWAILRTWARPRLVTVVKFFLLYRLAVRVLQFGEIGRTIYHTTKIAFFLLDLTILAYLG